MYHIISYIIYHITSYHIISNKNNEICGYYSGIPEDSSLPEVTQDFGANTFKGQAKEDEQSA
jgi:hypothetical protein